LGALWTSGCEDCDDNVSNTPASQPTTTQSDGFEGRVTANNSRYAPGERVELTYSRQTTGTPPPSRVDITFVGAKEVENLQFTPPPDADSNPPFYTWSDVDPNTEIRISFDTPNASPNQAIQNLFSASVGLNVIDASLSTVHVNASQTTTKSDPDPRTTRPPQELQTPQAEIPVWQITRWVDVPGQEFTTEFCQDWLDFLQSDEVFMAARFPEPTHAVTESIPLPMVMTSPYSNTLKVRDLDQGWPPPAVITVPMEIRPERLSFANNHLPNKEGEAWVTLGLSDDQVTTCPAGLNIAKDRWHLFAEGLLDFSNQPDNCDGCSLTLYYCYEGQDQPMGSALTSMLLKGAGIDSLQIEGITCIGPHPHPLNDSQSWIMEGSSTDVVSPGESLAFHHFLILDSGEAVDINLTYSSTLDIEWKYYQDDGSYAPDLTKPITLPINLTGFADFWIVCDPVPVNAPAGPHSLTITATDNDSGSMVTSNLIWVGDWVAPPTPKPIEPPPVDKYYLYLPLVLR
jgi:hypothetical protein